MPPTWLKTLFEKWHAARGSSLSLKKLAFRHDWPSLLADANIRQTEDRRAAERDLLAFTKAPPGEQAKLKIKTHRYRTYLIEKVIVPLESEAWLMETFGHTPTIQIQQESLLIVQDLRQKSHLLYPELWKQWCEKMTTTFQEGKNLQPLAWKKPEEVRELMTLVHRFTSELWLEGTMIRDASVKLGLSSKELEKQQSRLEACLRHFFGHPSTLESFGLVLTESKVELAGDLTLHYPDGSTRELKSLRGVLSLPLRPDLEDAVKATTSATRLLTVENSKTTLRGLAARNAPGDTLLTECSFPSKALIRLLQLLPPELPIHHFGDTDPFGFLILSLLRQRTRRFIQPFRMAYRNSLAPIPLSERDRAILPGLLTDPYLEDVRPALECLIKSQNKGQFEQESLGQPDLDGWPFYRIQ